MPKVGLGSQLALNAMSALVKARSALVKVLLR
jgi:hypothetical protein